MNILLAPDSYKDALPARKAANAMATGIQRASPKAQWDECPMGDGGEGTLDALIVSTQAQRRYQMVQDALGRACQAAWGWHAATRTAYIELAEASGLQRLTPSERTAMHTSTHGVGELMLAALDEGAERLVLMLGGSATNDAGAGMLQALGARLLDDRGQPLPPGGAALLDLARVELDGLDPRLASVSVETAVDVDNPLLGERGATAVFGPQKGANEEDVARLEAALANFADKVVKALGEDYREMPGAGAAGGMGFAARAFLGAELRPGIELVMDQVGFRQRLAGADLVITGEGRLDGQSLSGKTPIGIARRARDAGVPVVVLAGSLGEGWQLAYREGVTAALALADGPMALEEALARCAELLADRTENVVRLFDALPARSF
ncbi:glycerate kinase [Halomonas sp. MCCC 1A17488]|uniref:glycerate kinase n=1 Tax=unclassified Halomonas TaxID=2609666 RepID=UPI0018D1F9BE|nr:glycerate kinase [Halomonas sp. SS10-MC5]MCE8014841.1 glycerate kinase [Halomonas sp. MCCC 1A17488]MCG3238174.1 glycerate kinase [Halomonas sp. MCCC 1A17488]QPP48059.1 glycerate kinase [Halomonas sp. SS10-MC5]